MVIPINRKTKPITAAVEPNLYFKKYGRISSIPASEKQKRKLRDARRAKPGRLKFGLKLRASSGRSGGIFSSEIISSVLIRESLNLNISSVFRINKDAPAKAQAENGCRKE